MSRQHWQLIFLTGAVFNILVTAAFVFLPAQTMTVMGFEGSPTDALWYALFWWLVTIFGVGYYMVSRDPEANRGIAFMGFVGKLGVWAVTVGFWAMGGAPLVFMLLTCVDLAYSLLYLGFLRSTALPQVSPAL
jgi:voltage-gated potassium channel Kch